MSLDQIAAAYDGADRLQSRVKDTEARLAMATANEAQASTALEAERAALSAAQVAWQAESTRLQAELATWQGLHLRAVSATASAESRATDAARTVESLPVGAAQGTAILHRDQLRRRAGGLAKLRNDLADKVQVIQQKVASLPQEPDGSRVDQLVTQRKSATAEVATLTRELSAAREELGQARAALQEVEHAAL